MTSPESRKSSESSIHSRTINSAISISRGISGSTLPKKVYAQIRSLLFIARHSSTREEGMKHFEEICSIIERGGDKSYSMRLRGRVENYLTFLSYPDLVRKHIYMTNAVESINAGLEYIRRELGGYFPSHPDNHWISTILSR